MTIQTKRRREQLLLELKSALANGTLTKELMDRVEAEDADLTRTEEFHRKYAAAADSTGGVIHTKAARGSQVAPLGFDNASVKALHDAVVSRQSIQIKGFSSPSSLLPPQLYPNVLGPIHENRLLDRLPTLAVDAPSLEYVRHVSTTGTPSTVAEGAVKPELVPVLNTLIATVVKIACHTAVSYESLMDRADFTNYLQGEVFKEVADYENYQLLYGSGAGNVTGLTTVTGVLTHNGSLDTGTNETGLDSIEKGIAILRTAPSYATPTVIVMHPETWSALRRVKSTTGFFLVSPDPTRDETDKLWGIDILETVQATQGTAVLIDGEKFGRVIVRDALSLRTGTNEDDFTRNLMRFVVEERLQTVVERPSAICVVSGLPTYSGS
jgi:HK97 family phage major capsid protein